MKESVTLRFCSPHPVLSSILLLQGLSLLSSFSSCCAGCVLHGPRDRSCLLSSVGAFPSMLSCLATERLLQQSSHVPRASPQREVSEGHGSDKI